MTTLFVEQPLASPRSAKYWQSCHFSFNWVEPLQRWRLRNRKPIFPRNLFLQFSIASRPQSRALQSRNVNFHCWLDLYLQLIHCTMYTIHCTLYTLHCALYSIHCTLYTFCFTQYTVNTLHFLLYTVHCALYPMSWTLYIHTDPWLFEGTWWRTYRVIHLFRFSVARDQLPVHKRMIDSPVPESWILKPSILTLMSIKKS